MASWVIGFNFRATSGYVTDGANETYVIGDVYSTTRAGFTFGWTVALSDGTRDRDAGIDVRLAGVNKALNTSNRTFRVDLPNAGNIVIRLALGDQGSDRIGGTYVQIQDTTTPVLTISDADGTLSANFDDATGVNRTTAAWPAGNLSSTQTFSTTQLNMVLGDSGYTGDSSIAHLHLEYTEPASDLIVSTPGTIIATRYRVIGC